MGYDQSQRSSSSGVLVAVLVAVLLFAVMAVLVVVVGGLFFVRSSRMPSEMVAYEQVARAEAVQANADATVLRLQTEPRMVPALPELTPLPAFPARPASTRAPAKIVSVKVQLDRQGDASVDGEEVDLDALKAHLTALKQETNSRLSLELDADAECQFKHIVFVLDMCKEIGDIDCHIASIAETVIQE